MERVRRSHPCAAQVTDHHHNYLVYHGGAFAMWHANTFDVQAWRLYLVQTTGNATFSYVDAAIQKTVRRPEVATGGGDPYTVARLFRIGRCGRTWHSILVDSGVRFSFGFMLTDATAADLARRGRAVS